MLHPSISHLPVNLTAETRMQHDSHGYWKATLGLLTKILIIWFLAVVSG